MTRTTRQRIHDLLLQESRQKYPNLPDHARVVNIPTDGSANGLTKLVIKWIELHGGQAERINTMGRMVDKRKVVTDVLGRQSMIGSIGYIPTTGTKGSADISAIIKTKNNTVIPWKIEIKIGKDKQSDVQKKYEDKIKLVGGKYDVVKNFDEFVNIFDLYMNNL